MMKIAQGYVECDGRAFAYKEFTFTPSSYSADRGILDCLVVEGHKLAEHVNPTLARDASKKREYDRIVPNCIGGVIAEYCWREHLNKRSQALGLLGVYFKCGVFESAGTQIDIIAVYPDGSKKTVEVRSSFAYAGWQRAVCRNFDMIGWYTNEVKRVEIRKEYYVRGIFDFPADDLPSRLEGDALNVFLTGGATRKLLEDGPNSRYKEMIPREEIDVVDNSKRTKYRVVEPIANGFDTVLITDIIAKGAR